MIFCCIFFKHRNNIMSNFCIFRCYDGKNKESKLNTNYCTWLVNCCIAYTAIHSIKGRMHYSGKRGRILRIYLRDHIPHWILNGISTYLLTTQLLGHSKNVKPFYQLHCWCGCWIDSLTNHQAHADLIHML